MEHFLKRAFKSLSKKKYRKNPGISSLTPEQYAALNVGAINAEQAMYFCDSLETGAYCKDIAQNLMNFYDIVDRESAIDVLEWLKDRGHRIYFRAIRAFVAGTSVGIDDSILLEDEKSNTYEFIKNLNEATEKLIEKGYLGGKEYLANCSVAAWDMGRLVLLVRCCYDLGYLSLEEAWKFIMTAQRISRDSYYNWEDFASDYIIGRCMWNGPDMMTGGLISVISGLLKDTNSPWLKYTLN